MPYVMAVCVFNALMVGVRFVDIGGIVANHCFVGGVRVAHLFSFLCCPIVCLCVL